HRSGGDVAFALRPIEPQGKSVAEPIASWLDDTSVDTIGFNVSGLILKDPQAAREQYGLRADYGQLVAQFLRRVIAESDARIVLVPHVLGGAESDVPACERVLGELGADARDRVAILPPIYDQSEIKWVISRFDWFCGTRMHSTIAALSTGVPTAAIAYGLKTRQ